MLKYYVDISLNTTILNPSQVVVLDDKNECMKAINSNNPQWYENEFLYRKYMLGEDELVEVSKEHAGKIASRWGAELIQ